MTPSSSVSRGDMPCLSRGHCVLFDVENQEEVNEFDPEGHEAECPFDLQIRDN